MDLTPFSNTMNSLKSQPFFNRYRSFPFVHSCCSYYYAMHNLYSHHSNFLFGSRAASTLCNSHCSNKNVIRLNGVEYITIARCVYIQPFLAISSCVRFHTVHTQEALINHSMSSLYIIILYSYMYRFQIEITHANRVSAVHVLFFIFERSICYCYFFAHSLIQPNPDWRHNAFLKGKCDVC